MSEHKGFIKLTGNGECAEDILLLASDVHSVVTGFEDRNRYSVVRTHRGEYAVKETVDQIAALLNANTIAVSGFKMNEDNKMVIEEDYWRHGRS